jgi:hypothetical protein
MFQIIGKIGGIRKLGVFTEYVPLVQIDVLALRHLGEVDRCSRPLTTRKSVL